MFRNSGELNKSEKGKGLEITGTTYEEGMSGIAIIADYNELEEVLYMYGGGVGPNSETTARDFRKNSGNLYDLLKRSGNRTIKFINSEIILKVKEAFKDPDKYKWNRWWNYDGEGLFYRTGVTIKYDRLFSRFILYITAAYAGQKPEIQLAKALEVDREILNVRAELTLPEMADQDLNVPLNERATYRLDCEPIANALTDVVRRFTQSRNFTVKPMDIARSFMLKSQRNEDLGNYKLNFGNGLILTIGLYGGSRFIYPNEEVHGEENLIDTRNLDGSTVVLPFPVNMYPNKPLLDYGTPRSQIRYYTISVQVGRESADLPFGSQEQVDFARGVLKAFVENLKQ